MTLPINDENAINFEELKMNESFAFGDNEHTAFKQSSPHITSKFPEPFQPLDNTIYRRTRI